MAKKGTTQRLKEMDDTQDILLSSFVILAITTMFKLWNVLASRIGRIMTSGLYGLLFGTPLLVYNLMRDKPIPGFISLAAGFVLGIIGYGLVVVYDRTKQSKYVALFVPLWLACLCILSVIIVVTVSILSEWK